MTAWYNEIDPDAAAWLRELIKAGHIAPGIVDERSIEDVTPADLAPFTQCHFFAGIGIWSYALRSAGIADDFPIWTGSCPCQPFSAAGQGAGFDDERHLWPHWHYLISQRKPANIVGEQVASKDAGPWLDLVHDDLEGMGYAFGAVPFPSAGVGAPHIRDRLYWIGRMDYSDHAGPQGHAGHGGTAGRAGQIGPIAAPSVLGRMAHTESTRPPYGGSGPIQSVTAEVVRNGRLAQPGSERYDGGGTDCPAGEPESRGPAIAGHSASLGGMADHELQQRPNGQPGISVTDAAGGRVEGATEIARLRGDNCGLAHTDGRPDGGKSQDITRADLGRLAAGHGLGFPEPEPTGPTNGFWADADWLFCRDGKWRPVEPRTQPLAHGMPRSLGALSPELQRLAEVAGLSSASLKRAKAYRVGALRGYGNAINASAAIAFIESCLK